MWVGKNCRIILNIVRSGYRFYPVVSDTGDIDFTELGQLNGSKPDQAYPNVQGSEKQDDLITIGFRVKPREKAISAQTTVRIGSIFVNARSSGENLTILVNPYASRDILWSSSREDDHENLSHHDFQRFRNNRRGWGTKVCVTYEATNLKL